MKEKNDKTVSQSSSLLNVPSLLFGCLLAVAINYFVSKSGKLHELAHSKSPELYRGMHGLEGEYDLIVVGAGLSGAVIAEQASSQLGLSSLVIDKRDHIGGNCYDEVDEHGIRVSVYGVHLFHTIYPRVENYVKQFATWIPYEHRCVGEVRDINETIKIVPIPPNIDSVNTLFGTNIKNAELDREPLDGEEMSISRVGKDLYERIFKPYTKKQWDKWPKDLDASVLARLPVRSIVFEKEYHEPEGGYYQPRFVVNHPGSHVAFTRISEYKHSPNQPDGAHDLPGTVIYKEYSTDDGEPYYPVPNPRNRELYAKYQRFAAEEPGVTFVGRLASYKYFNMDQAILNALELFDKLVQEGQIEKKSE